MVSINKSRTSEKQLSYSLLGKYMYRPKAQRPIYLYIYILFNIYTYYICLFCSHNVNIMKLYATVVHERGWDSYKTRFNLPFTWENACTKSWIWQLLSIRLMCLSLWFYLPFDWGLSFLRFLGVQYFWNFTFYFFTIWLEILLQFKSANILSDRFRNVKIHVAIYSFYALC